MSPEDAPPPRDRLFFPAALILLLVAGGYALWRALVGVDLLTTEELAVPVVLTIAIAAGALLGWWRDRRRATVLLEAHRRARGLAESEAQARAVALEEVDARLREESAARQAANDVTRAAEEQLRQRHAELRRQTTELEEAARQKEEADRRHADQSEQQAATVAGLEGKLRTETDAHAAERTARERAETELSARGNDLEESRSELETARAEVAEEQARRRRMEDARRSEIEWISRLRQEVLEREAMRGVLGDPADMPSLVLRMAMSLLEADKGLLLSRTDEDADGSLDLAASEGFEHDPSDSALAQRFAHQVIEVDRIIRHDDPEEVAAAHRTPADDEIETLVAIPIYLLDKFSGVVICANRPGGFAGCDNQVLIALGNQAGAVLQNARLRGDLRTAYLSTVRVLADAMEAKDGSLRGHGNEVASYSAAVADRMGLEPKQREEVVFGSLLHDVGKIGISELLLLKPGPLSLEEYNIVKLHPRIGYRLVQQVPALDPIALGILHHHERFDGRGYPSGLKGEEIPQEARIICVADAFSAMTSDRPYRGRMSADDACDELQRFAGAQFDPEIVGLFIDEVQRRPPNDEEQSGLAAALADPELQARRSGQEQILGQAPFALTDSLTLLYSHRYFHEALGAQTHRAAVQSTPFALIVVELDGLGDLNRRDGYAAGDAVIQRAARAVHRAAAHTGGVACRLSGKRLALILPHMDEAGGRTMATGMLADVGEVDVRLRPAVSAWRAGDLPQDVLDRAWAELGYLRVTSS